MQHVISGRWAVDREFCIYNCVFVDPRTVPNGAPRDGIPFAVVILQFGHTGAELEAVPCLPGLRTTPQANGPQFSGKMCRDRDTVVHFEASRNSEADPADPADPPDPVLN